ncbi:unnamed protein product [Dicrocoelium dendriticum]|nr:unnamed protein product [Dicrocoelium dendriticum]
MQPVIIENGSACGCRFGRQWRIPCAHMVHFASLHAYDYDVVLLGSDCVLRKGNVGAADLSEATDGTVTDTQMPSHSDGVIDGTGKMRIARDMFGDLEVPLLNMCTEEFLRSMGVMA